MRRLMTTVALLVLGVAQVVPPSDAQAPVLGAGLPQPRLFVAMPPAGKAGSTLDVTVSGLDLEEPQGLFFSHPGIKAEYVDSSPGEPIKGQPKVAPKHRFKVAIPADTPLGTHDVRIVTKWGLSNPRAFVIGDNPVTAEKEPNNDVEQAQRVELESTVGGTISAPTDVDYFLFAGKKGQRVAISCLASSIDSRLHAALQLYSLKGAFLAFNRDYRGTDALLDATLPEDGDYYVRVFSFTYVLGGPDYFYRLTISTAPWIDAVYPSVVEPGKAATLTVFGRNLPDGKPDPGTILDGRPLERATVTVNVPNDPLALQRLAQRGYVHPSAAALDGFDYRMRNSAGTSNPFLLTYARGPVVLDNEANDTADQAQEVTLPCEIAGRIEKKRDRDWYAFTARKGEIYSVEAFGDRLGSPLNLSFTLRDAGTGKTVVESADSTETLTTTQFVTRTEDPARYRFLVPADGKYQLMVTSREAFLQAGPRQLYRVRIVPERPDFHLIVMPQSANTPEGCTVGQGGHQAYTVLIWRLDGFNGDVTLTADGLPTGVTCPPQTLGVGAKQAPLVLAAAADAPSGAASIRVLGTATINGQKVEREVRPATITWPAVGNAPTIARLDHSLALAVREQAPFSLTVSAEKETVTQGDKLKLTVKAERHWADLKGPIQLSALSVPANMTLPQPLPTLTAGKDEAVLMLDVKTAVPVGSHTIVLRGQTSVPFSRDPAAKQKPNVTINQPAGPLTIAVQSR